MSSKLIRTASITWTKAQARAMVTALGAATPGVTLNGAKVKFLNADIVLNTDTALGDVSASIAALGTAGTDLTWSTALNLNGRAAIKAEAEVVAGADPAQETLHGAIILNAAADTLLGFYKFPVADQVPIVNQGDGISLDVVAAIQHTEQTGLA